jgi:putative transposase
MIASVGEGSNVNKLYDTDLDDTAWAVIEPELSEAFTWWTPACHQPSRRCQGDHYMLRTGRQWRLLRRAVSTRQHRLSFISAFAELRGVWIRLQWILHRRVWLAAGRPECPTVVMMDWQSVKTTERGGTRGFDGRFRRQRHAQRATARFNVRSDTT